MTSFLFGGILSGELSGAGALLITSTGLIGGAARYAAVLANRTEREAERATAVGFFFGFGLGALALVIDSTV